MINKHRHYGRLVVIAMMWVGIVMDWIPMEGWADRITGAVQALGLGAGLLMMLRHNDGALCEKCIEQMPLNGDERAEKRFWVLWGLHQLWGLRWGLLGPLAGLMAFIALAGLLPDGPWRHSAGTLAILAVISLYTALHVHERLQPWCPFCRWGDGGHEEPSPEVAPSSPQAVG